jgi:hypothetical protein
MCSFECARQSSISALNSALYKLHQQDKLDEYNNSVQKQVTAWGGLRNDVDHHNFANPSDINANDVKRMIDGVRDFVTKYLT